MRAVDTAVLAALEATGIETHDSIVIVDAATNTVNYPLPFLVYYSSIGSGARRRLHGRTTWRSVYFQVIYVGADRNQTKWAGEKARAALEGKRLTVPGHNVGLVSIEESHTVFRDDDAIRPDGSPLFYGRDYFALPLTHLVSA